MRGLFVNHNQPKCSIYECGLTFYRCLDSLNLGYYETSSEDFPEGYDYYVINYHYSATRYWSPAYIQSLPGKKISYLLETGQQNPYLLCPEVFDAYCIPDPTMREDPPVFVFPRPLSQYSLPLYEQNPFPIIGSFGFASEFKQIEDIAKQASKEFEISVLSLHFPSDPPYGDHSDERIGELSRSLPTNVSLKVSQSYLPKEDLIRWCSQNTVNVFWYAHDHEGLSSAATDAVSSGRPILVNGARTFRHIHKYLPYFPNIGIREAIGLGEEAVAQMRADWSPDRNLMSFQSVLQYVGMAL